MKEKDLININMITFKEFSKFPIETRKKMIQMVFGSNIKSEIKNIEHSILNEGAESEFAEALLENIDPLAQYAWGKYYGVHALVYVSSKEMGEDPEEDNS